LKLYDHQGNRKNIRFNIKQVGRKDVIYFFYI